MSEEDEDSLHLYAINFRNAHTHHAAEMWQHLRDYVDSLVAARRNPLTDEELETAYREIWRNLPEDFNYGAYGWIEQGIRYAEKAHGIGG